MCNYCGLVIEKEPTKLDQLDSLEQNIIDEMLVDMDQILKNSGLQSDLIIKIIKENNFNILYNVKNNSYEDINTTTVIDPIDVLINSLKNAISIAGMLLTTSSLIINEYNNNLNKINDFNEL